MKTVIRPEIEMKNSGIEWIGNIPKDWKIAPIKVNFNVYAGATPSGNNPVYWDGNVVWITPADYKTEDKYVSSGKRYISQEGYDNCSAIMVPANSIIFSKRAPIGTVAISKNELCTNQGCLSCVSKDNSSVEFYYYAMSIATEEFELNGSGTTFKEISLANFKNFRFAVPPLSEQQVIADYLDKTCSKIDEIIAEAKVSIDEYKELKQSAIFEAVTKGLNKNVEMRECSVNWLDEIPSTWESIRLKYLLTEINNRSETGTEQPLSVSQVMGVVPSYMISVSNPTASYVGQKIVEPNDIVFNKLKAHLGVFFMSKYHGLVSPDYAVYRTNDKVIPKYLEYLFHTSACISEFKKYISGVAEGLMRLYTSDLFNIRICLPKVDEQIKIVEYVDNNVELFDSLIAEKESLINDLEAYKKSLIYEVVTGKRRVV